MHSDCAFKATAEILARENRWPSGMKYATTMSTLVRPHRLSRPSLQLLQTSIAKALLRLPVSMEVVRESRAPACILRMSHFRAASAKNSTSLPRLFANLAATYLVDSFQRR